MLELAVLANEAAWFMPSRHVMVDGHTKHCYNTGSSSGINILEELVNSMLEGMEQKGHDNFNYM